MENCGGGEMGAFRGITVVHAQLCRCDRWKQQEGEKRKPRKCQQDRTCRCPVTVLRLLPQQRYISLHPTPHFLVLSTTGWTCKLKMLGEDRTQLILLITHVVYDWSIPPSSNKQGFYIHTVRYWIRFKRSGASKKKVYFVSHSIPMALPSPLGLQSVVICGLVFAIFQSFIFQSHDFEWHFWSFKLVPTKTIKAILSN